MWVKKEIAALKAELEALRRETAAAGPAGVEAPAAEAPAAEAEAMAAGEAAADALAHARAALEGAVAQAGRHPLAAALGAFALGTALGLLFGRRGRY